MDNYLTWFAVNILFLNHDTKSQNFYLYSPTGSNCWYFLPWDYDGAWGYYSQAGRDASLRMARWNNGISNWWNVVLHKRFISKPENLLKLFNKMDELLANHIKQEKIKEYLNSYIDLILDDYLMDLPDIDLITKRIDRNLSKEEVKAILLEEMDRLPTLIKTNYDIAKANIQRPMPFFLGQPSIADGKYKFNWDKAVDLQGDDITYYFAVSKTPDFATVEFEKDNYSNIVIEVEKSILPKGTYYYKVIAKDSANSAENWQYAFDIFRGEDRVKHFGIREFVVE